MAKNFGEDSAKAYARQVLKFTLLNIGDMLYVLNHKNVAAFQFLLTTYNYHVDMFIWKSYYSHGILQD